MMLDRSSDLSKLVKKINGGSMSGNIKKIQAISKPDSLGKTGIQPKKKCRSCSRKKKG